MSGAMNLPLYSRINYVHSPDGELLCGGPGIIKTMHNRFSAYTYCIMPTPGADTEETGRYDLAWKDLCSARMLSVNSNELSKV